MKTTEISEAKPVACLRGSIVKGLTYDAEVFCSGVQVVIGTGYLERASALAAATPIAAEINGAMAKAALQFLSNYKEAKP